MEDKIQKERLAFAKSLTDKVIESYPNASVYIEQEDAYLSQCIHRTLYNSLCDMEWSVSDEAELYELVLNRSETESFFIQEEEMQVCPAGAARVLTEKVMEWMQKYIEKLPETLSETIQKAFTEKLTKRLSEQICCSIAYEESDVPKKSFTDRGER